MDQSLYSNLTPGQIRLLQLLPAGCEGERIECRLFSMPLDSAPPYEAISYEWNAAPGKVLISINSELIEVIEALESALRAFRSATNSRMLWADGICVNQKNKDEVRDQLLLLERVYQHSRATLVWLGPSTSKSATAVKVLHSLALLARQRNLYSGTKNNQSQTYTIRKQPDQGSVFYSIDDMVLLENDGGDGKPLVKLLRRNARLSDDEIFHFSDSGLWREIDGLFQNSYFERTWIQREVAKAPCVRLYRGSYTFSWPLFSSAFTGRCILVFHPEHSEGLFGGALRTVIDARERWRTPTHATTLAGALVALSYSKETRIEDHIYAAYAMSKHVIPWLERPIQGIASKELMLKTACACITERNDLYHLGQWCVASRKMMELPTWAPDFTSGICELAVQNASESTSKLIDGFYNICGEVLCLDCHLLDTVEWCHVIEDYGDIENIAEATKELESIFRTRDESGLFQEYILSEERWTKPKPPDVLRRTFLQEVSQAEEILRRSSWCSKACLEQMRLYLNTSQWQSAQTYHKQPLVIEALWSLLIADSPVRQRPATPPGRYLFLAWLYLASVGANDNFNIPLDKIPKVYSTLLCTLIPATIACSSSADEVTKWTHEFTREHIFQTKISQSEPECIFVTEKGFLGRTAAGEARKGDVVSILGGGWTPYLLERVGHSYKVKTFAYVEGLTKVTTLPAGWHVERICLR